MFRSRKRKIHASASRRTARSSSPDREQDAEGEAASVGVPQDAGDPPSALQMALEHRKRSKKSGKRSLNSRRGGGGPVARSFDVGEADDDDGNKSGSNNNHSGGESAKRAKKRKKEKRKRGLGFGGGLSRAGDGDDDGDGDGDAQRNPPAERTNASVPTYGKEELEQLRCEQQKRQPEKEPQVAEDPPPNARQRDHNAGGDASNPPHAEESFIPLDGGDPPGGATIADQPREPGGIFSPDPPREESHAWEEAIEQRAGIRASHGRTASRPDSGSALLSLDELSQKLASTIGAIEKQRESLGHSANRRRADREHALADSKAQETTLASTGRACEFYQRTRLDLAPWVGALRDLGEKIEPIAKTFLEMLAVQSGDFDRGFRSWQDDCTAALREADRLDRVLGRQPDDSLPAGGTGAVLDEFGRDLRPQHLRDRDARFRSRAEHLREIRGGGADGDAGCIVACQDHGEGDRSEALREALGAALSDLDDGYSSGEGFRSVFDRWFAAYPEDYQQCYATLSFGDLYAVLVKLELCRSGFFPGMLVSPAPPGETSGVAASGGTPPPSPSFLDAGACFVEASGDAGSNRTEKDAGGDASSSEATRATENEGRLARVVEKALLPMLCGILKVDDKASESRSSGDAFGIFLSPRKSLVLSKLVGEVRWGLQSARHASGGPGHQNDPSPAPSSGLGQKLERVITSAIQNALDGVAIPIARDAATQPNLSPTSATGLAPSEAEACSVKYTTTYQVRILRQALCNIIQHWLPLVSVDGGDGDSAGAGDAPEDAIRAVLGFISDKYLVLLSSLETAAHDEASPQPLSARALFQPIWEALNKDTRKIIESPSLMMSTMPLRAAALAYQLQ